MRLDRVESGIKANPTRDSIGLLRPIHGLGLLGEAQLSTASEGLN